MSLLNLVSLLGLVVLAGLAWAVGGFRRPIAWRTITGAGLLMLIMGIAVFVLPQTRDLLMMVNDLVIALLGASRVGAEFLLGPLMLNPGETTAAGEASVGFILAAQVLPAVIFFASLMAAGYHLGLIQPVIRLFGRLFRGTLQLSGAEALAGSSNIFVGIESAIAVGPYLAGMTRSELLTLLNCAMSTVASTTLALYVFFLQESFPQIAGHLISASVLSIPAAALVSKLMLPETGQPETLGSLPPLTESVRHGNTMAALSAGSWDGLKLAAGIAALLVAVLGLVGVLDLVLTQVTVPLEVWLGAPLTLQRLLGWAFTPLAWLLGLEPSDLSQAGQLLGQRILLTEVVAYQQLGEMAAAETLSPRTLLILSYALCGFAPLASVGIFVGGIAALVPSRRDDLAALAFPALAGSTLGHPHDRSPGRTLLPWAAGDPGPLEKAQGRRGPLIERPLQDRADMKRAHAVRPLHHFPALRIPGDSRRCTRRSDCPEPRWSASAEFPRRPGSTWAPPQIDWECHGFARIRW